MTKELRKHLDYLDNILSKHTRTARSLWNVLTALRGPDNGDNGGKGKSGATIPIRRRAFPKTAAAKGGNLPASFGWYGEFPYDPAGIPEGHFRNHVQLAATALSLRPKKHSWVTDGNLPR